MELTISNVNHSFRNGFRLDIGTLSLRRGELTFVLGPNGSGKTTLLRLLAGEIENQVCFQSNGQSWTADDRPAAMVRQKPEENLASDLSVLENLVIRSTTFRWSDCLFPAWTLRQSMLSKVNDHDTLGPLVDRLCDDLSQGQKQILAFVSVTSSLVDVLCLDEFLSAADPAAQRTLRRLVREYVAASNACVLVVTHDLARALEDADRIVVLQQGSLRLDIQRSSPEWTIEKLGQLVAGD